MLETLHIENVAVIKDVTVNFGEGLTVLTGETGAGKSVIIDCLNLVCGARASKDMVRAGEESATVEAVFDRIPENVRLLLSDFGCNTEDGELVLSFSIFPDGRSNIRANGKSVTKGLLRQIGKSLVSVCGQDDARVRYTGEVCTSMLDSFAGDSEVFDKYSSSYTELQTYKNKLEQIKQNDASLRREKDMLEYQIRDIDSKKLRPGEEEVLEEEKKKLGSIEKINKQVAFSYKILHGAEKGGAASFLLARASSSVGQLSSVVPELAPIAERLLDMSYEVTDLAEKIKEFEDDSDKDPTERIDRIESRLEAISSLKRRYGQNIKEILDFRNQAAQRLDEIENLDSIAAQCGEKINIIEKQAQIYAGQLSGLRKEAAKDATEKVLEVLKFLDMPKVNFEISVESSGQLGASGGDRVDFMIAANPGEELKTMDSVASGGELSRVTLALRNVMNEKDSAGCTVYDEIDTGISGKTSRKMGLMLKNISKNVQVICVTHSAQIATLADEHYLIQKNVTDGRAQTTVKRLDYEGRIEETARILGGIKITEAQREAARQLLSDSN